MKFLIGVLLINSVVAVQAGAIYIPADTLIEVTALSPADLPPEMQAVLDKSVIQNRTAIFVFNESSHPLGKMELYDNRKPVRLLKVPLRMNRCTLLYSDTGSHRYHTMYQRQGIPVQFMPGQVYVVLLYSRSSWPLPYALMPKDKEGNEYGPVLWHFVDAEAAKKLWEQLKNKQIVRNGE